MVKTMRSKRVVKHKKGKTMKVKKGKSMKAKKGKSKKNRKGKKKGGVLSVLKEALLPLVLTGSVMKLKKKGKSRK